MYGDRILIIYVKCKEDNLLIISRYLEGLELQVIIIIFELTVLLSILRTKMLFYSAVPLVIITFVYQKLSFQFLGFFLFSCKKSCIGSLKNFTKLVEL